MAKTLAQLLMEQRKNIEAQMRALLDSAEKEERSLSAEETEQFEKMSSDMDSLRKQADSLVQAEERTRAAGDALEKAGVKGNEERGAERDVETQLRSFLKGETRSFEGFGTEAETRALSTGTLGAGGATVPTTFYGQLMEHAIEVATMLAGGATTWTTTSGENIDVPVTVTHPQGAQVSEGGVIPQSDPVFGKRTLGSYKYGDLIEVPKELLEDTGVDLQGYLARAAGWAIGNALGQKLIIGTGTSEPAGIVGSSTLGKTAGSLTPTFDDVIDLFYSVIGPYRNRPSASWVMEDTTAGYLRKLKDGNQNYIWQASVIAGTPDTIEGKPVRTDPYMPVMGANAKPLLFGDLASYVVRLVNGVRFESSEHFSFNKDVITFRALVRGDGLLMDQSGAVKHLLLPAA
ncbi:phage major capsid protein [Glutamicibacter halophytocola]|uniref:Phage major capsid protein n=1 Tax=Glutamicibacter halophytocola TaxID=1933880 RepID=A0ABX5Y5E8_9MICC|nr:phage major capsid protein [Glutamicibacter halophytocola]QDY64872.1 phage major capsid protein [Glutamicibacter halophytocola]